MVTCATDDPETAFQEIGPGKSPSRLARWLDTDAVVHGISDLLLATQIPLSGLHTNMSQQELNLFKLSTSGMAQPGAGATLMPNAA